MKIAGVRHWMCTEVPEKFRDRTEISMEEIEELSCEFDVAVMHHTQVQPSKREKRTGAPEVPDLVFVWIDVLGGRFRQR